MNLLYLLRRPAEPLSSCLYVPGTEEVTVVAVDHPWGAGSTSGCARLLNPGSLTSYTAGHALSCPELLELVLRAEKVVTL